MSSLRSPLRFRLDRVLVMLIAAGSVVVLEARPVVAQMDEPHGYIEPCTIANYQEMMTECDLCPVAQRDPESCSKRLEPLGYEKKCRTRGDAASWGEVWCVAKRAGEANHPAAGHTSKLLLAGVVSALLLGGFLLLRRSRSRQPPPS